MSAAASFPRRGSIMTATSVSMTLPAPMELELRAESRGQREPTPPARRSAAAPWQDWVFEHATMLFAMLVLAMLLGIIGALSYAALPALQKFGFGFFFTNVWNPVTSQF